MVSKEKGEVRLNQERKWQKCGEELSAARKISQKCGQEAWPTAVWLRAAGSFMSDRHLAGGSV